jgi:HK97 family phage prohead protease
LSETTAAFVIEWRAPVSTDERIVGGIAVPWNEVSRLTGDSVGERFLPGSLTRTVKARGTRLKLYRGNHGHDMVPVGVPVSIDPRHADGLWTTWRIARTPVGDQTLEEVREGLLDSFSIGFRDLTPPGKRRSAVDGVREIHEAELGEVTLLPSGAYDGARVLEVRAPVLVAADLTAWLAAHPVPQVDRTPLPDLHRFTRRA